MANADIPKSSYVVAASDAMLHHGVTVAEMPCCGFSFTADHTDSPPPDWKGPSGEWVERYTCPVCAPPEVTDEMVERADAAMRATGARPCSPNVMRIVLSAAFSTQEAQGGA